MKMGKAENEKSTYASMFLLTSKISRIVYPEQ